MNMITAINTKYQTTINRAYKALRAYYALCDLDGTFNTETAHNRNERAAEKKHNAFLDLFDQLTLREKTSFHKQHFALHGYI